MTGGMKYGDVALGVESALPAVARPLRRRNRVRFLITWLIAALNRWA
jgi:hypothetical protein